MLEEKNCKTKGKIKESGVKMDIDKEIVEKDGETYFSKKACLLLMLDSYLFPYIDEYKAYLTCKRKTEYMALLLATKGYYQNKSEAMREIRNIKNKDTLLKYIDKIDKFISFENLLDILSY